MTNAAINWDELKKRYWDIGEIITTVPHVSGQKVAKVGDFVVDWDVGVYRVSAVDSSTNVATLEIKLRFSDSTLLDPSNGSIISALSMYMPNSATRVMVDKDVNPYTITTDHRFLTKGVEATSFRAFFGTDVSSSGEVISGNYDGSGNLITDIIDLYQADPANPNVMRPPVFETTRDLQSDQIITYLFYDAAGRKVGIQPFLVSESGAFFDYATGSAYITGIELRGDLMDPVDTTLINNPLHNPFQTALLEAWLKYSDGTEVKVPIDGNKCVLHGTDDFNTSQMVEPKNVVLSYYCDPGEPAINTGAGEKRHISVGYKLANIGVDTSFALKVYVVPEWQDASTGYTYRYFLGSLDRDLDAEVTAYVTALTSAGDPVPGTNHGNEMTVTIGLDLDSVLPGAYPGHYHTQNIKLTTAIPGTVGWWPWAIDYIGDGATVYGEDVLAHCSTLDDGYINIGRDFSNIDAFLYRYYLLTNPLFDFTADPTPPTPTHAVLINNDVEIEIDLATQWNQDITCPAGYPTLVEDKTLTIKWIVRDGSNDYIVGWSPVLIQLDL